MDGTESLSTILIRTIIQVVISIIVLCFLYFAAYKPIKRHLIGYFWRAENREEDSKPPYKKERAEFDYVSAADKGIKMIEEQTVEYSSNNKKRTEMEDKKLEESIINKAKKQINEERDNAIKKMKREYADFLIKVKGKDKDINKNERHIKKRK